MDSEQTMPLQSWAAKSATVSARLSMSAETRYAVSLKTWRPSQKVNI
jgi:hypothetical protein